MTPLAQIEAALERQQKHIRKLEAELAQTALDTSKRLSGYADRLSMRGTRRRNYSESAGRRSGPTPVGERG